MPNCRNCGARLNKWDSDVCPICGIKHPLEGVTSETVEVTKYGMQTDGLELDRPKTRKSVLTFFCALGWTGAGYFYLKFKKMGIIWLSANLAFIGGIGTVLWLLLKLNPFVSYLITFVIAYLVNSLVGVYYLLKGDVKDGDGEFIQ